MVRKETLILSALLFLFLPGIVFADARTECLAQNPADRIVYNYSNNMCIQVDCIQEPYSTDPVFQYCDSGQGKYKYYDVTFEFPTCTPIYSQKTILQSNEICAQCQQPVITTEYKPTQCLDDKKVYSRNVTTYASPNCSAQNVIEYQLSNEDCFITPLADVKLIGITLVGALIVIGWLLWKKR